MTETLAAPTGVRIACAPEKKEVLHSRLVAAQLELVTPENKKKYREYPIGAVVFNASSMRRVSSEETDALIATQETHPRLRIYLARPDLDPDVLAVEVRRPEYSDYGPGQMRTILEASDAGPAVQGALIDFHDVIHTPPNSLTTVVIYEDKKDAYFSESELIADEAPAFHIDNEDQIPVADRVLESRLRCLVHLGDNRGPYMIGGMRTLFFYPWVNAVDLGEKINPDNPDFIPRTRHFREYAATLLEQGQDVWVYGLQYGKGECIFFASENTAHAATTIGVPGTEQEGQAGSSVIALLEDQRNRWDNRQIKVASLLHN